MIKSLNWLKQAPKQWYEKFDFVIIEYGFKYNSVDNVFIINQQMIFAWWYVFIRMTCSLLVLTEMVLMMRRDI